MATTKKMFTCDICSKTLNERSYRAHVASLRHHTRMNHMKCDGDGEMLTDYIRFHTVTNNITNNVTNNVTNNITNNFNISVNVDNTESNIIEIIKSSSIIQEMIGSYVNKSRMEKERISKKVNDTRDYLAEIGLMMANAKSMMQ